ncbi:MAG: hypothetical protein NWE92_06840 [Candidatus Bathyarchaeota archaeon]|nr:hypothetical protein [Candidatus Bathyarchaeota archaeon]
MARIINWVGVAAGIVTLLMVAISLYMPWWKLVIGEDLFTVNASPVYFGFGLLGSQFTVPLLWALNITLILTYVACGAVMLLYSLIPTKPYAKDLLDFSYRKPIYALVGFVVGLVVLVLVAGFVGVNVPLMGSAEVSLPQFLMSQFGVSISVSVVAAFMLPFGFAIAAAVLCIVARIYHPRLTKKFEKLQQQQTPAVQPTPAAAPVAT